MAAPVTTARPTPTGDRMDDAFKTVVALSQDPDIKIWEKTVKPPGADGGEAIPTTTMHNEDYRTFAARALKTMTDGSVKFAYDPAATAQIEAIINVEGSITIHFPNGGTLDFFGFARVVAYDDMAEGTQPEGTLTLTPTNWDPDNKVEEGPVYTPPA